MKKFIVWAISFALKQQWVRVSDIESLLKTVVAPSKVEQKDEVIAVYPDWVESRLTPNLETGKSTGVAHPRLVLHDKQVAGETTDGHTIYAWLINTNQLSACVELADLQWWEQHSE
ncbi:MAG: hypothetical protein PHT88_05120 [Candidatus Moranbacteria bacterium]|nr:hypothetical protein [Candidatus Moranbacteria bacterium]